MEKQDENITIKVYSGLSVEDKCRHQLHPINEVKQAEKIVLLRKSTVCYSNSSDFVSAIKYLCKRDKINVEFFLDGVSNGSSAETIFEEFNKSFDLMVELCPNIDEEVE